MDKDIPLSEVETIFSAFGPLLMCRVLPNTASTTPEVQSVVVEFADAAIAATTATSMNAFELGGRTLKCEVIARLRCQQLLRDAESTYLTVLLENMVTLEDTKDPDLKDEISDEARNFGTLKNVELLIERAQVKVKLTYGDNVSAVKALRAMHGRVFAGNKINAVLAP